MQVFPTGKVMAAIGALASSSAGGAAAATIMAPPPETITIEAGRPGIMQPLPVSPMPASASPRAFLLSARVAVGAVRPDEAEESLERAETRLLGLPPSSSPAVAQDEGRAISDIGRARHSLAAHDKPATLRAIDDAVAALDSAEQDAALLPPPASSAALAATQGAQPAPPASIPPSVPMTTYAWLPGHWRLHDAAYEWVPPDTAPRPVQPATRVPGRSVWINGAYVWVPQHDEYP